MLLQEAAESSLLEFQALVVLLLALATLVGILLRRLRMPYTVGLVLVGLALSLLPQTNLNIAPSLFESLREFEVTPELILGLLVPPLIYEAAFHLRFEALRRNLPTILAFAILGVIVTSVLVGGVVTWGTGIPISAAILFGSLVAATDPVAVIALFREIGVPKRLQVLLEGESLLNDGTAIVLFTLAQEVAIRGEFSLLPSIAEFLRVAGGGLIVGLTMGYLVSLVFRRIDAPLIETTLTLVLAYGSYLVAENIHVSGVLAIVAAGLLSGNIGPQRMSPTSRIQVFNFWEIAAFLANSFVFLFIGLQIDLSLVVENWQAIGVALLAVLVARAAVIFGLSWTGKDLPRSWLPVLYWGGLRGAISLALALSLSPALGPDRNLLQAMAFGVVLFTLLVQGPTMEQLVRRMQLITRSELSERYMSRNARLAASRAAYQRVLEMHHQGAISDHIWERLAPSLKQHTNDLVDSVSELIQSYPEVELQELDIARRESLRAQRSVLTSQLTAGTISEEVYSNLSRELDAALEDPINPWTRLVRREDAQSPLIDCMLAAVIQVNDAERVMRMLRSEGFRATRLPSTGGFLGRRNITLLVGFRHGQEEQIAAVLRRGAQKRLKFIINPLEGWQIPIPTPRQVMVGGATLFIFDVEDYREF